ncbi:Protein of unknown function [Sinosporangium album]|uniref:DUF2637 domain-containing protein n=1 Tax=Sinosporangium album TaxID=504805 RepID=A0A1G8L666_9ACTN|nr:DUF2637 domain-containing protein [Sinosporangium album]SDI51081.1 Protein of unknown function [Sinosporangium album]
MFSLKGREGRNDPPRSHGGDDHREPLAPWSADPGIREIRHYKVSPKQQEDEPRSHDRLSGKMLLISGIIIAISLVGAGYVAYDAQRKFALEHLAGTDKEISASIIAALPDVGWIAMALVALVAALRGQSSLRARLGVLIFFGLSLAAQILYAPRTPEGVLVAVIAPIALAWMLESLIIEVRRWAGHRLKVEMDETPILTGLLRALWRGLRGVVALLMWVVRFCLDRRGTWGGVRDWVLETAPIAPGRTLASLRAADAEQRAATATYTAEQVRAETAEQMRAIESAAEAERAELTRRAAEEIKQTRAEERERQLAAERALREALDRAQAEAEQARAEAARLATLAAAKTGKERLITLYEQLGESGDPRYMDLSRASEVARELYQSAGLSSEGTARTYLYDHIKARSASEMSPSGGMIEAEVTS